mgnify:CR=1 FL=1
MRITKEDLKHMILEIIDESVLNLVGGSESPGLDMDDVEFVELGSADRQKFSIDPDLTTKEAQMIDEIHKFFLNISGVPAIDLFDHKEYLRNQFERILITVDPSKAIEKEKRGN